MLKNGLKLLPGLKQIKIRTEVCWNSTNATKEKWDLFSSVCLERKPIITPVLSDLEKEYKQLMKDIEFERSLKSKHEMKHEDDIKQMETLKKGGDVDEDTNLKQTAQDLVDSWKEELSKFTRADRITEADKKNDWTSLNRKLDKHLVLVTNLQIGDKKYYVLPQGLREEGETLRQTTERVLRKHCGPDMKVQIYGNAPCGFYKYKYPENIRHSNGVVGAKVFIYFARYLKGQMPEKGAEYKWLDRQELQSILPPKYSASVAQMLFNE